MIDSVCRSAEVMWDHRRDSRRGGSVCFGPRPSDYGRRSPEPWAVDFPRVICGGRVVISAKGSRAVARTNGNPRRDID